MLKIDFSVISNYNELKESIFFEITNFINEKLNSNEQRQQKIDFLNQGTNSKDFLLNQVISLIKNYYSFIIKSKVNSKKTSYLTSDDLETLYEFSYQSRINWFINPVTSLIEYRLIKKRKRQLSLKSSGSYYTPTELCTFMAKTSINTISLHKEDLIKEFFNSINHELCEMEINNIILFLKKIIPIKLIDISVGSGRFLRASLPFLIVYLKKIKNIVLSEIKKNLIGIENEKNSFLFSELMKKIDIEIPFLSRNLDESENSSKIINFLIKNCIFGIDIDEKAVELSKILLKIRIIEILGKNNQNISSEIKILHRNSIISVKKTTKNQQFIRNLKNLNGIIWERDFPEVFSYIDKFDKKNDDRQGFDLVIGNPPWEILKPNDREFFRNYIPDFQKQSRKEQDTLKKQILKKYPKIRHHYDEYINNITSMIKFIKINKLFAYQGSIINGRMKTGDPQLFKFLLEIAFQITAKNGIISYLIQHNFLGSKGNSGLRKLFLDNGKFDGIWEFYNKIDDKIFFPNVDLKQRFIIIKYLKKNQVSKIVKYKKCNKITALNEKFEEFQQISIKMFERFSKEEMNLFTFLSAPTRSAFEKLLKNKTIISDLNWNGDIFKIGLSQDLHVTRDRKSILKESEIKNRCSQSINSNSSSFIESSIKPSLISINSAGFIPVYGGKNIGPYYFIQKDLKHYIYSKEEKDNINYSQTIKKRISINKNNKNNNVMKNNGRILILDDCLACRNILPNSAKRLIFSIIPPNVLIDNSCTRISVKFLKNPQLNDVRQEKIILFLIAIFNSFIIEFYLTTFLTGINLNYYLIEKIPIPRINSVQDLPIHPIGRTTLIEKIIGNTKYLISHDSSDIRWIQKYEENEAILAFLFDLSILEFSDILDLINFKKLNNTTFCGVQPYKFIKKERIIENYNNLFL